MAKKKLSPKKPSLPEEVFVRKNVESDADTWYLISDNVMDATDDLTVGDEVEIGVYRLDRVKRVRVNLDEV